MRSDQQAAAIARRVTGAPEVTAAQRIAAGIRSGATVAEQADAIAAGREQREHEQPSTEQEPQPSTGDPAPPAEEPPASAGVEVARLAAAAAGLPESMADLLTGDAAAMRAQAERLVAYRDEQAASQRPTIQPRRPAPALTPSTAPDPFDAAAIAATARR